MEEICALMANRGVNIDYINNSGISSFRFDRILLEQVFINLIENSIDACKNSRPEISVEVTCIDGAEINITMHDNGGGIDADILENIFTPFFTTKKDGTGIGLYLCREIIDKHDGSLRIHSEANRGTTCIISLPLSNCFAAQNNRIK